MRDEVRESLRKWVDGAVRIAEVHDNFINASFDFHGETGRLTVYDRHGRAMPGLDGVLLPPLTPAKLLALSVLVGEPVTGVEQALADYMLDQGHDYAQACYEKGKVEEAKEEKERQRIASELRWGELQKSLLDGLSRQVFDLSRSQPIQMKRNRMPTLPPGWTVNNAPLVGPPMPPPSTDTTEG